MAKQPLTRPANIQKRLPAAFMSKNWPRTEVKAEKLKRQKI
jgi:hypothetical protein